MKNSSARLSNPRQIEILIELGRELSTSGGRRRYSQIARSIRSALQLSAVTVWVLDKQHKVLINEALDADPTFVLRESDLAVDERIAHEQVRSSEILMSTDIDKRAFMLPDDYKLDFVSVPIFCRNVLRGTLNLYNCTQQPWFFSASQPAKNAVFLESLAGQLAVCIENRELELDTTFYKEVHHRIKNSLETVASLLRMQIRRLDRISAEQALEDSISRVMTIALVHETLTQGETGFVDCGRLITSIACLLTTNLPYAPEITLAISGSSSMVLSREATSLALVANELIQNALSHGLDHAEGGRIHVALNCMDSVVELVVTDDGLGLPPDFDLASTDSLGLTIVSTLVSEDLRGQFTLTGNPGGRGTVARVCYRQKIVGAPSQELLE